METPHQLTCMRPMTPITTSGTITISSYMHDPRCYGTLITRMYAAFSVTGSILRTLMLITTTVTVEIVVIITRFYFFLYYQVHKHNCAGATCITTAEDCC